MGDMGVRNEPVTEEVKAMNDVQVALKKFLAQFNRVEAMVIVGAMNRVARELLDGYPEELRRELTKGTVAYFERREMTEESSLESLGFVVPKGLM